jgi:hypothetical protein
LKFGFLIKGGLPRDRGTSPVEDEVISLLPNMPGGNDEDLNEEGVSPNIILVLVTGKGCFFLPG